MESRTKKTIVGLSLFSIFTILVITAVVNRPDDSNSNSNNSSSTSSSFSLDFDSESLGGDGLSVNY